MAAIEMLIKVKDQTDTGDLMKALDEIAIYEKLSRVKSFRDLKTSEAAAKKCPFLSRAYNGDIYASLMVQLAGNILSFLTGRMPDIARNLIPENETRKEQRAREILEQAAICTNYRSLEEYNHVTMAGNVSAVFVEEGGKHDAVIILCKDRRYYTVYQGYYEHASGALESDRFMLIPIMFEKDGKTLSIETYSMLGNNAYPFAEYQDRGIGAATYAVSMPSQDVLCLRPKDGAAVELALTADEQNMLELGKTDIHAYGACLLDIIVKKGVRSQ